MIQAGKYVQQRFKRVCASAQSDQSLVFRLKKHWTLGYPYSAHRRLLSDCADVQADLSLRWAHTSTCTFSCIILIGSHHDWFKQLGQELQSENAVPHLTSKMTFSLSTCCSESRIHCPYGNIEPIKQSKTLLTIDDRGSKIARNSVFNCHLSPVRREDSLSDYF